MTLAKLRTPGPQLPVCENKDQKCPYLEGQREDKMKSHPQGAGPISSLKSRRTAPALQTGDRGWEATGPRCCGRPWAAPFPAWFLALLRPHVCLWFELFLPLALHERWRHPGGPLPSNPNLNPCFRNKAA